MALGRRAVAPCWGASGRFGAVAGRRQGSRRGAGSRAGRMVAPGARAAVRCAPFGPRTPGTVRKSAGIPLAERVSGAAAGQRSGNRRNFRALAAHPVGCSGIPDAQDGPGLSGRRRRVPGEGERDLRRERTGPVAILLRPGRGAAADRGAAPGGRGRRGPQPGGCRRGQRQDLRDRRQGGMAAAQGLSPPVRTSAPGVRARCPEGDGRADRQAARRERPGRCRANLPQPGDGDRRGSRRPAAGARQGGRGRRGATGSAEARRWRTGLGANVLGPVPEVVPGRVRALSERARVPDLGRLRGLYPQPRDPFAEGGSGQEFRGMRDRQLPLSQRRRIRIRGFLRARYRDARQAPVPARLPSAGRGDLDRAFRHRRQGQDRAPCRPGTVSRVDGLETPPPCRTRHDP